MGEPIETFCVDGMWRNSIEGRSQLPGEYLNRELAVEVGRDEARVRGLEHVVRRVDGSVSERNRYPRRSAELPAF